MHTRRRICLFFVLSASVEFSSPWWQHCDGDSEAGYDYGEMSDILRDMNHRVPTHACEQLQEILQARFYPSLAML